MDEFFRSFEPEYISKNVKYEDDVNAAKDGRINRNIGGFFICWR